MPTPVSIIESLWDASEAYGKTTFELLKLKILEGLISSSTYLITKFTVILAVAFFMVFFSIGIAGLLGDLLGKMYYGLFIVAMFYLVVAIVLHFFMPKWIEQPISASIIDLANQK